jgi:hypothetical protein
MSDYHKDLLLEIIDEWNDDELRAYVFLQEERLENTRRLVQSLKEIQRKRKKRKIVDTGDRSGT